MSGEMEDFIRDAIDTANRDVIQQYVESGNRKIKVDLHTEAHGPLVPGNHIQVNTWVPGESGSGNVSRKPV